MPESFGARLRQRREERQIALSSIADETKIKLSLLEALERDDVSHWPSGLFRRAYIRAYAHMIGLDPDDVVREFVELYPEPSADFTAAAIALASSEEQRRQGPPTRLRTMVDSAIGSLVRLGRPAPPEPAPAAPRVHAPVPAMAGDIPGEVPAGPSAPHSVAELALDPAEVLAAPPEPERISDPLEEPEREYEEPEPASVIEDRHDDDDTVAIAIQPVADAQAVAGLPDAQEPPRADTVSPEPIIPVTDPTIETVAGLCTAFARVVDRSEIQLLLQEAARLLDSSGLIVWVWDGSAEALRPALVHGYSEKVIVQLPVVKRDADNVTAAAFRTGQTCEMAGTSRSSGALVVPLLTPQGCAGVLALELQPGVTETRSIRAVATILAAMLTQLVLRFKAADVRPQTTITPAGGNFRSPVPPIRVRR